MSRTPVYLPLVALAISTIAHAEPALNRVDPAPLQDLTAMPQGSWSSSTPSLRFCSFAGCNPGDHLRAQTLMVMRPDREANIAELNLALETRVSAGYSETWTPNIDYPTPGMKEAGSSFAVANGQLWKLVKAGRSASVGSGPKTKPNAVAGTQVADGTAIWRYDSEAISDFKAGLSNVVVKERGGGSAWGIANNVVLSKGASTHGVNVGAEWDFGNFTGHNCGLQGSGGAGFCVNLWLYGMSAYLSTAAIAIGSAASSNLPGAYVSAIWLQKGNGNLVHPEFGEDIKVDSSGAVGISFGATDPESIRHKIATIRDFTTSGSFLQSFGTKNNNVWQDGSTTPLLIRAEGNYKSGIIDLSAARGSNNALSMHDDQRVCWSSGNICGYWSSAEKRFILTSIGNKKIMSVDLEGNLRISGKLMEKSSP